VELAPSNSDAYADLGVHLWAADRSEEAIEVVRKAMRFSPFFNKRYHRALGRAYREAGQYAEAIGQFEQMLSKPGPTAIHWYVDFAAALMLAGRANEASATIQKVLMINPNYSWALAERNFRHKDLQVATRIADALHRAGLPEE
jgi:tetratricopeptide (TPR) repeat protein